MTMPAVLRSPVLVACLTAAACDVSDVPEERGEARGPLAPGKADGAEGSCGAPGIGQMCGGQSTGSCWCDDQCDRYGDCCADYVAACVCDCEDPTLQYTARQAEICAVTCEAEPPPADAPQCVVDGLAGGRPRFHIRERDTQLDRPIGLHAADLDADGHLDLVAVDRVHDDPAQTQIVALLGRGDGTFRPVASLTELPNPDTLRTVDVNGDGRLDLTFLRAAGNLVVYQGDGFGGFGRRAEYDNPQGVRQLAWGDLDGDGDVDAVVTRSNRIYIKLNDGTGRLGLLTPYDVEVQPLGDLSVVDFDGDGVLDVVATRTHFSEAGVLVLSGMGDGTLDVDGQELHVVLRGDGVESEVTDLDGDGVVDIAMAVDPADNMVVRFGRGGGDFSVGFDFQTTPYGRVYDLVSGDFNCDGKIDLAMYGLLFRNGVSVMTQRQDGSFQYGTGVNLDDSSAVAFGDFDGDGARDFVAAVNIDNHLNDIHEIRFYRNELLAP